MIRNALIAGAGSGLSASLARLFAREGISVTLAARNTNKLRELCDEVDGRAFTCDVTNEKSVTDLFSTLDELGQTPQLVVYNAGHYANGAIEDLHPDTIRKSLEINALGAFLVAQAASVRMKKEGGGAMLFTGATAGVKGFAKSSAFAMGKFALRGLCQSLARELAPQNIHVTHFVLDGMIHNPARGKPYDNINKTLHPDKIAEAYLMAARQHNSAWSWEIELRPFSEAF